MGRRGFTLIELLAVIVIIGILVAVAVPRYIASKERGQQLTTAQKFLVDSTAATVDAGVQLYRELAEYDSLLLFDKWLELRKQNHSYNFVLCTDIIGYERDLENVLVLKESEASYLASYGWLLKLGNDLPTEIMRGIIPGVVNPDIERAAVPRLVTLERARKRWHQIKGDWDEAYRLCEASSCLPSIPRYEHSHLITGNPLSIEKVRMLTAARSRTEEDEAIIGWFSRRSLTPPTLQ